MREAYGQSTQVVPRSHATARARQRIAPSAIQGLEVLALPVSRLQAYIKEIVESNPLLDLDYGTSYLEFDQLPQESEGFASEDAGLEAGSVAAAGGFLPMRRFSSPRSEGYDMARIADACLETESLQSHVRLQLLSRPFDSAHRPFLDAIVDCLDDDGYFAGSMAMLCDRFDKTLEEGERALGVVQRCTPRGVGARDLSECLLLQVTPDMSHGAALRAILRNGLADLAENRTTKLMRRYHVTEEDLADIRRTIASLDPRPGSAFSQRHDTVYVIPDITVNRGDRGFSVSVSGELGETLVMNDDYKMLASAVGMDEEAAAWIEAKRAEAEVVLANIDQRRRTLQRFGVYLTQAQYEFFCHGEARMRPLTMQQAADALGVHVSTVSRTVQDKHVLTPWGVYPLRSFFTSSLPTSSGAGMSSLAIKNRIKELIDSEDVRNPYSDAALTELLNKEGVEVKRRTVAKYRESLGIGGKAQRRR